MIQPSKVLFLDVDGVCNCSSTTTPAFNGAIGIDKGMAFRVGKITLAVPDLKVVLSSSWKHWPAGRAEIEQKVVPLYDVTPEAPRDPLGGTQRGTEIQMWLDQHPEVEKYAILDDDTNILDNQKPNFFKTFWSEGLTEETMNKVISHFNETNMEKEGRDDDGGNKRGRE